MGTQDLVRYREVRVADARSDQKTASQIADGDTSPVTQEDLQQLILSQLKRILHGDDSGRWLDDFISLEIPSLSSALDAAAHERLNQLIHFVDEGPAHGFATGAFKSIVGSPFPTATTWYVDDTMAQKIVEQLIVRNGNQAPTQVTWNVYAADGVTIAQSIVDTITLDGSGTFEVSRTRAIA